MQSCIVNTSEDNSVYKSGIVTAIYEGGVKDAVFKLEDDKTNYYINRGLENGLDLKMLKSELLNNKITLWYAKGMVKNPRHMTRLVFKDSIYYTEW